MKVSLLSFPGDGVLDLVHERVGAQTEALAKPPKGSELKPVPGEPGLPLIGRTLQIIRNGIGEASQMRAKYGEVFWSNAFGTKMVWAVGPNAAQEVLQNRSKVYSQDGWAYFIGPFFNRGLMLLNGGEHMHHRRIMQEAFTRPRLEGYQSQIQTVVELTVPNWPTDTPLPLYPAIKRLSLDIATRIFMGSEPNEETEAITLAFIDAVRAGTGLVRREIPILPTRWNKGLAGRKKLDAYFRRRIPAKRASSDTDLFAALCHVKTDDGLAFTDDDVVNHMIFLMMAAHDTSTITATAISYYLAKHPEWQDRARAESLDLGTDSPTIDQLDSLATLDMVFKESIRLVAPVPGFVRQATADTDLLGHHVPAGTIVAVVPDVVHQLGDHWVKGREFDPSRFADPREEHKAHRFGYIPFGGGAHKCIGMAFGTNEVKAVLHSLLTNFEIEIPRDYELVWDNTALVVPTDDFPVTLRPLRTP